jgi:hypothetical protein
MCFVDAFVYRFGLLTDFVPVFIQIVLGCFFETKLKFFAG